MDPVERLLDLLSGDPIPSSTLRRHLATSQPSLSRLLRRAGDRVIRIGRGRATCYAAAATLFHTSERNLPLFEVDARGTVAQIGILRGIFGGSYLIEGVGQREDVPFWILGESRRGLFASLPYFLHDLRPSGFLGRQIARRLALTGRAPADPRDWRDEQIGAYFLGEGHDLPGALIVGEGAAREAQRAHPTLIDERAEAYPTLAAQALRDEAPGSSAAGEQPKFAVFQRQAGHVIVKFSPRGDDPAAQRWRDLLRAEAHALKTLGDAKQHVAETELYAFDGRVFLESQRFDREGLRGRRHLISLSAVDAEYAGIGLGWGRVAERLVHEHLLDTPGRDALVWAETFGHWIGNSDMHLGNVSLIPCGDRFDVAPLYDMLPMRLAPLRGELPEPHLLPPLRTETNHSLWRDTGQAARRFWTRVAGDPEMSAPFRALAQAQAQRIDNTLGRE